MLYAAETDWRGFLEKFCELRTESRAVDMEVAAVLVEEVWMNIGSRTLEKQLRERDRELQKTRKELQIASCHVLETQNAALGNSKETRLSCKQFVGVEKRMDFTYEKVTSVEAATAEITFQPKEEIANLQKCLNIRQQRTAVRTNSSVS